MEVEKEVTEPLETAIQQLSALKRVESISKAGQSIITVEIKDKYGKSSLPQVWDELRRKVTDAQHKLPPGAAPSIVNDDYGDVYGILFAVHGKGYSYKELEEYADYLQRELLLVHDVSKVDLWGVRPREVHVEISRSRVAQLGISMTEIYHSLSKQNLVSPAGAVKVGQEYIRIHPTGHFETIQEIGNLIISDKVQTNPIYLKDIASIKEAYKTPPNSIVRYNGARSIVIGLSIAPGGNIITMGKAVHAKLAALKSQTPLGMKLSTITFQPKLVSAAIDGFIISLIEALAIVILVLIIFMGLRSGMIISAALLLSILGTFIGMKLWGISLERISLGALIIALGMLVDNAIVVTEGMLVRIQSGVDCTPLID